MALHAANESFDIVNEKLITKFLPIPILLVWYFFNVIKENTLYLISFLFTYFGTSIYNYLNIKYVFNISIVLYTIGISVYIYLVFKDVKIKTQIIFRAILFCAIILFLAVMLTYNRLNLLSLLTLFVYIGSILFFFRIAIYAYLKSTAEKELYLFISAFVYVISTFFTAINMFAYQVLILNFLAMFLFWYAHYFMCMYMIKVANKDKTDLDKVELT